MKIVELITDLNSRAGAEVFITSLANDLANKSNDVYLICLWDNIHPSFKDYLIRNDIVIFSCGKNSSFDIFKSIKKMKRIINSINPDIVHTHGSVLSSYYFAYGNKKRHWRLVHTFHNVAKEECNLIGRIVRNRMKSNNRVTYVGISNLISRTISDFYHIKLNNIVTIYNGIEFGEFPNIDNQEYVYDFVCVARFEKQKNHLLLFDAVKELKNEYGGLKVALVGTGSLLGEYKNYIHNNDLDSNIMFLGAMNNVYDVLKASKCFVLTSIFEGNPISVLEAMHAGKPVISSRVGGVPDIIIDSKNGFLFESNNKNELCFCMKKILTDDDLVKQIGRNNLAESSKYSIGECADRYVSLFKKSSLVI